MTEEEIKELAKDAGFIVTRNMQNPTDVINHYPVEARAMFTNLITKERLMSWREHYTYFSFYMFTTEDKDIVRIGIFNET